MTNKMKNLGRVLSSKEQKVISGGHIGGMPCRSNRDCWDASPYLGPGDVSCRYSPFGFSGGNKVCVFN